ncbi:hypothetical protein PI125_g13908 [Phytophthora idaei]|nr:hypothetical protein PI125_g13908 [Phytophthora idaei]
MATDSDPDWVEGDSAPDSDSETGATTAMSAAAPRLGATCLSCLSWWGR